MHSLGEWRTGAWIEKVATDRAQGRSGFEKRRCVQQTAHDERRRVDRGNRGFRSAASRPQAGAGDGDEDGDYEGKGGSGSGGVSSSTFF